MGWWAGFDVEEVGGEREPESFTWAKGQPRIGSMSGLGLGQTKGKPELSLKIEWTLF